MEKKYEFTDNNSHKNQIFKFKTKRVAAIFNKKKFLTFYQKKLPQSDKIVARASRLINHFIYQTCIKRLHHY